MQLKHIVWAAVIAIGFAAVNAHDGYSAQERWPRTFVSACVLKDFDPELGPSSIGVNDDQIFVYLLSVQSSGGEVFVLYQIAKGPPTTFLENLLIDGENYQVEPIAGVAFSPDFPNGYFENEGGMLSRALAHDIVDYFQAQPFRLVEDWKAYIVANAKTLPRCEIPFTRAKAYMDYIYGPKKRK